MSRARDLANLGDQAGSGFDASDLTTGTLGNTVQDNITRLGTVTTGTMNNTIGSNATFPAGHILQSVNATVTNVSNTAVVSGYVADVISQITIKSGNYVKITAYFNIQFNGSSNAIGALILNEGTVASPSTQLFSTGGIGDGQNSNYIALPGTFSFIDTSPASTTPNYCFKIARSSGGTTSLQVWGTPIVILEEINV